MKPRPLPPNGTIAVVAPASAPLEPGRLEKGIAYLEQLGYTVLPGRTSYASQGYLSGSDQVRLEELNSVLQRDDVDAIFCVRGGFGTLRILDDIDFEAAGRRPKLVVGYSDITALHLAFYAKLELPSVAGAMVAVDWCDPDPSSEEQFWRIIHGEAPLVLHGPAGEHLTPVRSGTAEGILIGGNLTLLTRLIGTPYLPSIDGAILFFEEVGEEPYRLDGLLAHLRLSGVLDRIGGLVVGDITEWEPKHGRPSLGVEDVLEHYFSRLTCPVARGLRFGHVREKVAVPVGVRARLEVDPALATLTVLEPVVAR